eukprot:TRINITY_DN587_c0_g1_i1.p1 TRINITY_DN587_c0_g1~~TRINITY_DN587_c0_g1_i1.p1  ORF type:complete len:104 (+),score=38.33 TRINITY_DN587_c0_g1_i1:73-384(+)
MIVGIVGLFGLFALAVPTAAGQPPSANGTCATFPGRDFYGGDLAGMPVALPTSFACCSMCLATSACLAFTFNEGGKDCWLKGTMQAGEVRWVKTATAGLALPP